MHVAGRRRRADQRRDHPEVMTSGFTFLRIDGYYREIVKSIIMVTALIADQYRQRERMRA